MKNLVSEYANQLSLNIQQKISEEITTEKVTEIVTINLYNAHVKNNLSASFQSYYFNTLNNIEHYNQTTTFFKKFKQQYSLQGINREYLDELEHSKAEILKLIQENNLVTLYFSKFRTAQLKRKDKDISSEQGSFFSKLVHTFNPTNYCALDNPVKDYFGLKKENFFQSFLVTSHAYKNWSTANQPKLLKIREEFKSIDVGKAIPHQKITDLKLLDMIFWSKADILKKSEIKK